MKNLPLYVGYMTLVTGLMGQFLFHIRPTHNVSFFSVWLIVIFIGVMFIAYYRKGQPDAIIRKEMLYILALVLIASLTIFAYGLRNLFTLIIIILMLYRFGKGERMFQPKEND